MFLHDDADDAIARLVLAHGAGAAMDSGFMNNIAGLIAERGVSVTRFEFGYMAGRRDGGKRRPAPRGETLCSEYEAAIERIRNERDDDLALFIGGKSMGGRVASLIAQQAFQKGVIHGLACLGYPFHPPGKPEKLRTAHLATLDCPALIVQGTRDALGAKAEVATYDIDVRIGFLWCEDGDHDLKPRKRSGLSQADHLTAAADAIAAFVRSPTPE